MRLKVIVTGSLLVGFAMMIMWPVVVGAPPVKANKKAVAEYALRFGAYSGTLMLIFAGVAYGAILIVRQAREEYQEEAQANLRMLIEGTLEAHRSKKDGGIES